MAGWLADLLTADGDAGADVAEERGRGAEDDAGGDDDDDALERVGHGVRHGAEAGEGEEGELVVDVEVQALWGGGCLKGGEGWVCVWVGGRDGGGGWDVRRWLGQEGGMGHARAHTHPHVHTYVYTKKKSKSLADAYRVDAELDHVLELPGGLEALVEAGEVGQVLLKGVCVLFFGGGDKAECATVVCLFQHWRKERGPAHPINHHRASKADRSIVVSEQGPGRWDSKKGGRTHVCHACIYMYVY